MYTLLKALAAQLLMPLPILLGLLCVGLLLIGAGRKRSGLSMAVLAMALLLLASTAPLADRMLEPLESEYASLPVLSQDADIEAVVVLGGGWQPDTSRPITGKLSEGSAIRLMEGVRLWRQRPELPLVVSGADRQDKPPVAQGYAQAAAALGGGTE